MIKHIIKSEKETENLAINIAKELKGGEVILLKGDLGAGKTTFTQYLARALNVTGHVNSPTFVIMKQYDVDQVPIHKLIHMDAYRISHPDELYDLGLDSFINDISSVVVIEWPEKLEESLDKYRNRIEIDITFEGDDRVFNIKKS